MPPGQPAYSSRRVGRNPISRWFRSPVALTAVVVLMVGAMLGGYFLRGREATPKNGQNPASLIESALKTGKLEPGAGSGEMEKSISDLASMLGGAIPATSLAKGFHVPDLGFRIAFLTPEQSASTLGALPAGAVLMEVESGRPVARAGLHVGDVVLSIAGKRIASEDDLRQAIFNIGPGKTTYSYQRGSDTQTVTIECPNCKAE
jgi:membrane-associated protease RseP (regulator of RpoE activity)